MDDQQIVQLFLERSEQAIEAVNEKYGQLCRHIAAGIVAEKAEAEECVSDAYAALWDTIPPQKPTSLRAYVTNLLRNIAYNRRDYQTAAVRDSRLTVSLDELQEILPQEDKTERMLDSIVIRDVMNRFLHSISKKDRFLFLRRYYYLDTCREIARMTGMSESSVSTQLGRLRKKLKVELGKEGIHV